MKKLFRVFFAILLGMSLTRIPVRAVTTINDASVNGSSIKPVAGKNETDCYFTSGVSKQFFASSQNWTNAKTGSSAGTFEAGMIVEYTAVFETYADYVFSDSCVLTITGISWNYAESSVSGEGKFLRFSGTYTVPYPDKYWKINVQRAPEEGGTVEGSTSVQDGEFLELTAKANKGYTFSHWMSEGSTISFDNPFVFLPKSDMNLTAVFTKDSGGGCHITAEKKPEDGGKISWNTADFSIGDTVTIEATPSEGFKFLNWTENGTVVSSDPVYKFEAEKDRHLVANFEKAKYTLTFECTEGGTTTVTSKTADYNTDVYVEANASEGYHFVGWEEDGKQIGTNNKFYFTANKDRTIKAVFEKNPAPKYNITYEISPKEGGSASGDFGSFEEGTEITVKAQANDGYHFREWGDGNSTLSTSPSYTFTVTKDVSLVAVFEKNSTPDLKLEQGNDVTLTDAKTPAEGRLIMTVDQNTDKITVSLKTDAGLWFDVSPESFSVKAGDTALSPAVQLTDQNFTAEITGLSAFGGKDLLITFLVSADPSVTAEITAGVQGTVTVDQNTSQEIVSNKLKISLNGTTPGPSPDPTPGPGPSPTPSPAPNRTTVIAGLLGISALLAVAIGVLWIIREKNSE